MTEKEMLDKLEKSCLIFTIEGKEVSKEELINYLLEKFKNTGDHIPRID